MTPLKPLSRPLIPLTVSKQPPVVKNEPPPADEFVAGKPLEAAELSTQLAKQTEHLRLFGEVFPAGAKPKHGVEVMFVSFKGDDRFVTKKLNAAAGNTLVKNDWAPRLEKLLKELEGKVLHGYRVKLLEQFTGVATLALVPENGRRDADAAARELATQLAVFLCADIKALGATAQGAMIRHAAALSKLDGPVQPDDVFFRALAANDEVVARKTAVLGPIEQKLRDAANGQKLSILAFGDEAVFALSDWSPESLRAALAAIGAANGARLVVTETTAVPGESFNDALDRNVKAMGASDRGNETLKELERRREHLRYQLLALPEPQRSLELAKLEADPLSHAVARVSEAGVAVVDARDGADLNVPGA